MSRERERFDEIGKKIKRDIDALGSSRRHMLGLPAGTLNTITPCAACKLLRRRCAQECPFSPYFSPHEPQKFASVHKVFGASNVSKLLMEVPENQRADAANSLVYEANVRLRDPVYGCMGAISSLQHQVQSLQAELNAVRAEILRYKYSETTQHHDHHHHIIPSTHHLALFSTGAVSVTPPPPPSPLPPPPPPPPPPPASSSSSMYTPPSTTTDYSTITNDNVSYFG
ncbi:hypothetical protein L6452_12320 [Arctium lappa]|uniref:Uncharacterized protein n=1 Tax=Arctium lappa TaxID=4217 RepID=A0ACB9DRS1_ARCLA|nr:hypothetical protein L6452_12320 [Arctium lappa]